MECCNSKALQISFSEFLPFLKGLIDDTNSNKQSLWPHFKFVVKLSEPVNQVLSILISDLHLHGSVNEIGWIHMCQFFFLHIDKYFRDKFDYRLWISNFENII